MTPTRLTVCAADCLLQLVYVMALSSSSADVDAVHNNPTAIQLFTHVEYLFTFVQEMEKVQHVVVSYERNLSQLILDQLAQISFITHNNMLYFLHKNKQHDTLILMSCSGTRNKGHYLCSLSKKSEISFTPLLMFTHPILQNVRSFLLIYPFQVVPMAIKILVVTCTLYPPYLLQYNPVIAKNMYKEMEYFFEQLQVLLILYLFIL